MGPGTKKDVGLVAVNITDKGACLYNDWNLMRMAEPSSNNVQKLY